MNDKKLNLFCLFKLYLDNVCSFRLYLRSKMLINIFLIDYIYGKIFKILYMMENGRGDSWIFEVFYNYLVIFCIL